MKEALSDFAERSRNENQKRETVYRNSRKGEEVKTRPNNNNSPTAISDFEGEEFYGSVEIPTEREIQEELRKEIESKEYVIATYGEETEEYSEAKLDLGGKEEGIDRPNSIKFRFWGK